jgi:WD40 repeat protein
VATVAAAILQTRYAGDGDDLLALGKKTVTHQFTEKDMNKRIIILSVAILIMAQIFLLSSCGNQPPNEILDTETPSSTPSPQPSATATLTSTPSPTLTPTPVPVTIQEAIQRGTFAELEVFNKGAIHYSPLSYIGQIIRLSTFSPDGQQFAAVTRRGVYVYDVKSWQELFLFSLSPEVSIASLNYSADSSLFATGDTSGTVTFWDTKIWEVQNSFRVHKGVVTSLAISPDNLNFVTIGDKNEISIWNMSDGSLIKSQFRSKAAGPAYYSLDGKWLYISEETGSRDLIIWNSEDLTLINRLGQLGRRPPEQAVSPYTNTAAAYGFSAITLYDFDKKETTELKLDISFFDRPSDMIFLDETTLMVKFEKIDTYHLFDLESHAITSLSLAALSKTTFKNPEIFHTLKSEEIKALGFRTWGDIRNITPDGTALILSGWNEVPSGVFDLNQKTMKKIGVQEFPWRESIFLSDGTLAGVDWSRPIRNPPFSNKKQQGDFAVTILSPEAQYAVKSKIKQPYDLPDYIDTAAISPNGKVLAVGVADGTLYLWNLDSKELITTIKAHGKVVGMFGFYGAYSDLFFDDDGSHLVTWGQDRKIKVINMDDLSEVFVTNGEKPAFSPDGSHLAYISSDGSIRLVSLFD